MPSHITRLTRDPPTPTPHIEAMAKCDICGVRKPESRLAVSQVNGETICLICYDEED